MIWKTIKGYPDYKISTTGQIFSNKTYKKLKLHTNQKDQYLVTKVRKNKKPKMFTVHRLVALNFLKKRKNCTEINHKDGNKLNNHVDNLEWCTRTENLKHAHKIGLRSNKGERNPNARLNRFQVQRIRLMKEISPNITQRQIALMFNITQAYVSQLLNNKFWNNSAYKTCING